MESVSSLKVHLLTVVSNMTVPQTSFLQSGPVKDNLANLAMSNGVLMLYYVLIHWTHLNMLCTWVYLFTSHLVAILCIQLIYIFQVQRNIREKCVLATVR